VSNGEVVDRETTQAPKATEDVADAYRQHRIALIRFATVLVGPDDAHDVVSAAVVRVLGSAPTSLSHPRAYLYQAVANQARNFKRGRSQETCSGDAEGRRSPGRFSARATPRGPGGR